MCKYGLKHFTIPFFPPRKRKNYVTNLKYTPGHLIKKKILILYWCITIKDRKVEGKLEG